MPRHMRRRDNRIRRIRFWVVAVLIYVLVAVGLAVICEAGDVPWLVSFGLGCGWGFVWVLAALAFYDRAVHQ